MRCWVFSLDASAPCVPVHLHFQIWPQISYNLGVRSTALSAAPRSRFCLTTTSDCFPTLYTLALTTQSSLIRSFTRSGTDRPFRPICSFPSVDSQVAAYNLYKTPCDLHSTMPTGPASKPVCRGRPYWTLACPQSTCSGWDGRFSQRRSSIVDSSFALPPAGFLHTDTRVHHKSHKTPPVGVQSQGTQHKQAHTYTTLQSSENPKWQVLTTESSKWYNDIPITATLPSIPLH